MASLNCNNQGRDSCFYNTRYGRSCSKAQACLERILHLISTIPPRFDNNPNPFKKRGFDIDLNLRLGSFVDDEEGEEISESSAKNFFSKYPDVREEEIEEKTFTVTTTDVSSDVTAEMQKSDDFKSSTDGEVKKAAGFNDSLGLLIEAAEMISDRDHCLNNDKDKEVEEVEESGGGSTKSNKDRLVKVVEEEGFEEIEDISPPVVRSKRGRSQVLPHRFRDSVLEPWKKKRPQRSTAAAAAAAAMPMVSKNKRRPR